MEPNKWDKYFMGICSMVASNSPCLSRQIGAVIVRDKSIISTGYNGPPRGVRHCADIQMIPDNMQQEFYKALCPRREMGYKSGEALQLCPAAHAEVNAITNAARLGVSVFDATLYLNTCYPCKDCMAHIINAGIIEIVSLDASFYDNLSQRFAVETGIIIRSLFND